MSPTFNGADVQCASGLARALFDSPPFKAEFSAGLLAEVNVKTGQLLAGPAGWQRELNARVARGLPLSEARTEYQRRMAHWLPVHNAVTAHEEQDRRVALAAARAARADA
eukprot:gene10825-9483_t